jgi:hypothetical protein
MDCSQLEGDDQADVQNTGFLNGLGDYARRELPRLLRPRLEDMLLRVIEEGLDSDKVVDLAQGAFQQILQNYKALDKDVAPAVPLIKHKADQIPVDSEVATHAEVIHSTDSGADELGWNDTPDESWDAEGVCDVFQKTVVDSLGNFPFSFDELMHSSGDMFSLHDSGYGSMEMANSPELNARPMNLPQLWSLYKKKKKRRKKKKRGAYPSA